MARSVMLSVRPEWVDKIVSGDKTIEIRKTRPKMEPPFKCYIYQTLPKYGDWNERDGRVVAEFVCDRIHKLHLKLPRELIVGGSIASREFFTQTQMNVWQMFDYVKFVGKQFFGWHISDLKAYDEPRALQSFKKWHDDGMWSHHQPITKAPQSWCYVEDEDE